MDEDAFIDGIDDLGDLFGDEPTASLPPATQKGLLDRLDELYSGGCCQKLAWSKFGGVAAVSADGSSLSIQGFIWDAKAGSWQLSEKCQPQIQVYCELSNIVHIAWSPTGLELAVLDGGGRVSILNTYIALDRLRMAGDCVMSQDGSLGRVVGLQWLAVMRGPTPHYEPATRTGSTWAYSSFTTNSPDPLHPIAGKGGLVCVTKGGLLRLVYQDVSGWQEISAPLPETFNAESILTHASFGLEQGKSLLLATHDVSRQLRVYRITIDWGLPSEPEPPQPSKPNVALNPSSIRLNVRTLQEMSQFVPLTDNASLTNESLFNESANPHTAKLSHLLVTVPESPSVLKQDLETTMILAVFNGTQASPDFPAAMNRNSIICRWKLHETSHILDPSFEKLPSKNKKSKTQSLSAKTEVFERLHTVSVDGSIVSVSTLKLNAVIVLAFEEGTIQFRDKATMQLIIPDPTTTTISNYIQGGFKFENLAPFLHVGFSPSHCLAVMKGPKDELQIKYMENSLVTASAPDIDKENVSIATAALTLLFAESSSQSHNNDDVLVIIQKYAETVGAPNLCRDIQMATRVVVDHSREATHERLLRSADLQRYLTLQHILGRREEGMTVASKLAWIILNLRFATLHLHVGVGTQDVPQTAPSEMPLSLLRVVKWFFDLASLIVDDAICFSNELSGKDITKSSIHEIMSHHNSASLCLLLGSIPRVFLRYDCRCIRALTALAPKRVSTAPDIQTRKAWINIIRIIDNAPVPVSHFEKILAEMDTFVKQTYESAECNDLERIEIERDMFTVAEISDKLIPVVKRLLTTTVRKFQDEVDPANLYFADLRWLGLTEDRSSREYRKKYKLDVMRKVILNHTALLRRCAVCSSYMEDILPTKGQHPFLLHAYRVCICGNPWLLNA